jgi:hypothetical protein
MCKGFILGLLMCSVGVGQQTDAMREVLDRLAKLEEQNRALTKEVEDLKARLGPTDAAPLIERVEVLTERVEVNDRRVAELDQTRVGSENKLPISLTGMLLFNAYTNGQASAGGQYPTVLRSTVRATGAGATFRQSIVGLKLDGPTVLGGAKVRGSVLMDFFGGGTGLDQTMRLRIATLDLAWKNTTVGFAFDKPIIAQRDPDSLAQVGVSPLTGAGNLWLWRPQARVEQRLHLSANTGLRGQLALYQTAEAGSGVADEYSDSLASVRPGYQGRVEYFAQRGSWRVEIATGFHASSTRVVGQSIASRIFTMDWLVRPVARLTLTGTYFQGRNMGVLGGLRQGVSIVYPERGAVAKPVHGQGGWAQVKMQLTQRASLNVFAGQQDDRDRDLLRDGVTKNQAYGGNLMYRWGSNFMTSFEASQVRTSFFSNTRINPHYDLAIAYLF